jgi:hypothetical protein
MVARERQGSRDGTSARRAVAVAWATALLVAGCGRSSGTSAGEIAAGDAGMGAGDSCIDVSHVDEMQRDDLEVIGTGFDAYDGNRVRILVTHGEPTYGLGETPIENGAFDLLLPGVLGDYTGIAVHIDRIRNNACDPDEEFIWQWTTGPASARGPSIMERGGRSVAEVTPDTLRVFEQAGPCNLNGIFDLATPLPCTN